MDENMEKGDVRALHSQKRASRNKSVDIIQQLVTKSQNQDVFTWLASCDSLLMTNLLQVVNRLVAN